MMIEQLTDAIEIGIDRVHDMGVTHRDYAQSAAKEVLAELPAMVKSLVWGKTGKVVSRYNSDDYLILDSTYYDGGFFVYFHGKDLGQEFDTLEAAKSAANAHHVAQVMAAFDIENGE